MSSSRITYDRASDEVDIPMGNPYYTWHSAFIGTAPTPQPTSDSDFVDSDKEESIEVAAPKSFKIGIAAPKSFKIGASGYEIKFHDNDPLPKFESTRKRKSTKKSNKSQPKKQKIDN